jgi:hypothetical protein
MLLARLQFSACLKIWCKPLRVKSLQTKQSFLTMITILGKTIVVLFAAALLISCAPSEEEADYLSRKSLLLRQNQGIRELIDEAERGSLVPADRFLVGLDEKIVGDLFRSQLPLERPIGERFVVRLEKAVVSLRDKYGAITIEGSLHRRATPERKTAVHIYGGLGAVTIDPETDLLSIRIAIDHIDLLQAGILESILGRGGKKFLAERGRRLLQDAMPDLKVPVALGRNINIPAVQEGAILLDSLVVPLNLSVERVIAAGGKLWVTLDAEVGKVIGAETGLGVAVKKKPRPGATSSPAPIPPKAGPDSTAKPSTSAPKNRKESGT